MKKKLIQYFSSGEESQTKSERLEQAILAMIADGAIRSGQNLPPQRDIAETLGIGLSLVTGVFKELKKKGILYGERGRGSFVAFNKQFAHDFGDRFSQDHSELEELPVEPVEGENPILCNLVERLTFLDPELPGCIEFSALRNDMPSLKHYGAKYLRQFGIRIAPENVALSHNAYVAFWTAFQIACPPGSVLGAPVLSFIPIFRNQLAEKNVSLLPLACDEYGIRPEALETACKSGRLNAITCSPECELPTTRIMSRQRRVEICDLARKYDLTIIENNWLLPSGKTQELPALPMLAPERVLSLEHASKMLSCGCFCSFSHIPAHLAEKFVHQRNIMAGPIPLLARRITQHWLDSGNADREFRIKNQEIVARNNLAREILEPLPIKIHKYARFCWLPLEKGESGSKLRQILLSRGVLVSNAQNYLVGSVCPEEGLLIGLCHEPSLEKIGKALQIIRDEVLK